MVYVWLGVMIAAIVIEAVTTQLVSVWFAAGALAAFIMTMCGVETIWIQVVVFVLVSVITLAVTRPLVRKVTKNKKVPTNADMVIGKIGTVTEEIDNKGEKGQVKMGGSVWTARAVDSMLVPEGTQVRAVKIDGVKLLVSTNLNSAT